MGRSVSYATGAVAVAYRDVSDIEDRDDWFGFLESLAEQARGIWPSLHNHEQWLDREDRVILANKHVFIGVSEYMGLASVWMVVRGDAALPELAERWAIQQVPKFLETFSELRKLGTFSNGEAVFERINA